MIEKIRYSVNFINYYNYFWRGKIINIWIVSKSEKD